MNVLSLFDGMSCGRIALEKAGIKVDNYYSSEIKKHAIKIANFNYSVDSDKRLGSIKNINCSLLPKIDLIIGGSPCQDFSLANKNRDGLKGKKSSLFFEYLRILQELKPKYFLLENVKMKKEEEEIISGYLKVKPVEINSKLFTVQNRNRLYWTNIPFDKNIQDRKLKLQNILCTGYTDKTKARTILASESKRLSTPIKMVHRYLNKGFTTLIFKSESHYIKIEEHFYNNFGKCTAEDIDDLNGFINLDVYDGVRYMNRKELEICQSVPIGYTRGLTDNEAYDLLGDGWTIDVITHILKGINKKPKRWSF